MGALPNCLYKYRKILREDNLSDCPNIQALFRCYGMLNSRKRFWNEDPEDSKIHLIFPSQNLLTQFKWEHPQYKSKLELLIEQGIVQKLDNMFNAMVDQYGIYCFSSTGINYRMWNKYAGDYKGDHTGFCIEFIREKFFPGRSVEYQEKFASMNMLSLMKIYLEIPGEHENLAKNIHRLLHIKLNKWKFEHEYRFINTGMLPQSLPILDESEP